ncbi:MAG: DUF1847 domain-containing protein [Candidatus Zixiibacteriota bacterium]
MNCANCEDKECYQGKDCFGITDSLKEQKWDETTHKILKLASEIEAKYYMKFTRLEELILFSKKMDYKKLGIAFCIGLSDEAKILEKLLEKQLSVVSVCCKVGGVDKEFYDMHKIKCDRYEAMCNPLAQAMILNKEKTDLNIILGLCMGHDILFSKYSEAPVTTLVVKDRVLAHNTVGALYSRYYQNKLSQI